MNEATATDDCGNVVAFCLSHRDTSIDIIWPCLR